MSAADDLLRRALDELEVHGEKATWTLIEEIRAYLDAPRKDEFLGYLHPNGVFDGPMPMHLVFPIALYAHPPTKTAPMTDEEIESACPYDDENFKEGFFEGIRFAEWHHGIGGKE